MCLSMMQERCAPSAEKNVSISVWRTMKSGVLEPWLDFKLVLDESRPAEQIEVKKGTEGSQEGSVRGLRSRLKVSLHVMEMCSRLTYRLQTLAPFQKGALPMPPSLG